MDRSRRNTGPAIMVSREATSWRWSLVSEIGETWAQGSALDQAGAMTAAWEANRKIDDHGSSYPNIVVGRE